MSRTYLSIATRAIDLHEKAVPFRPDPSLCAAGRG
jgi:hypothetical protein